MARPLLGLALWLAAGGTAAVPSAGTLGALDGAKSAQGSGPGKEVSCMWRRDLDELTCGGGEEAAPRVYVRRRAASASALAPLLASSSRLLQEREHRAPTEGQHGAQGDERGEECEGEGGHVEFGSGAFWLNVVIIAVLVCMAGLFSGLTIGLMSLDIDELEAILRAPVNPHRPRDQEFASKILPLVKNGHLLLVTLLLSNAAAMEALPLFLNKISPSELVSILLSVTLVLFFGEVIPQALCKAYGLAIGAYTARFVSCLSKCSP
jgi:hypothetical protein